MKKIKIHKESIKTILSIDWWIFLTIPLVVSGCFFYIFKLTDKPKDFEKIRIFSGFDFSTEINSKIYGEYRDSFEEFGILETVTNYLDEGSVNYALNFGDVTFKNYEIIIASQDEYNIDKGIFDNSTLTLDTNYYANDFEYLYLEDKPIGLKLYDAENAEYNEKFTFKDNIALTKTAYAFVSSKSVNARVFADDIHSLNELALQKFVLLF